MDNNEKSLPTPEDVLEDNGYSIDDLQEQETILFRDPDFSTAIIGVTSDDRVVYDYERMIEFLMYEDDIEYEEAAEFIDYNTIRAAGYIHGNAPIVMFPLFNRKELPEKDN